MTLSRGKKLALATLGVLALGTAMLFHRSPVRPWPRQTGAEGLVHSGLTRRLPSTRGTPERGQLLPSLEEREPHLPAAATIDPDAVGREFAAHPDRTFHPGGGLLERSARPLASDSPSEGLLADADGQPTLDTPAAPRIHKVADGDTLARLAARYLGSSDRYGEIFAANRGVLSTPDLLPIGVELVIPPRQRPAPPAELDDENDVQPAPAQAESETLPRLDVEMTLDTRAGDETDAPVTAEESPSLGTSEPADESDAELVPVPKGALREDR